MSANAERVAAMIRDLADIAEHVIKTKLRVDEAVARETGYEIAQSLCDEYRGQQMYMASNFHWRIDQRDREMYAAYVDSGRDAVATAKRFDVSVHTVYRRVRLVESAEYAERQSTLFDADD